MRDFKVDENMNVTKNDSEAVLLFEQIARHANALTFRVTEKSEETGNWKANGSEITIFNTLPTRKQVVQAFLDY